MKPITPFIPTTIITDLTAKYLPATKYYGWHVEKGENYSSNHDAIQAAAAKSLETGKVVRVFRINKYQGCYDPYYSVDGTKVTGLAFNRNSALRFPNHTSHGNDHFTEGAE